MSKAEEALPPLPEPYMRESIATASNTRSVRHGYEQGGYARWPDMFTADQMRDYARAALAQRQQVPEGWQLVPKTPTGRMIAEAGNKWVDNAKIYRAMLAAAPALTAAPPAQQSDRCDWCCGTGRFADHACRFCGGKAKGSVFTSQQQQSAQPEQQEPQAREPARTICG